MTVSQFGALDLPVPASEAASPAGDPGLGVLLAFLTAVVNAATATAWGQIAPPTATLPSATPVTKAFPHDPNEVVFTTSYLPCLFGWRGESTTERIADDYLTAKTPITVVWVFPLAAQNNQATRSPFRFAVESAVRAALELRCDPSWYAATIAFAGPATSGGHWTYTLGTFTATVPVTNGDTAAAQAANAAAALNALAGAPVVATVPPGLAQVLVVPKDPTASGTLLASLAQNIGSAPTGTTSTLGGNVPGMGSDVCQWAGLIDLENDLRAQVRPVEIKGDDFDARYRALELRFTVVERLQRTGAPFAGVVASLQTLDSPPFVINQLELEPS